MPGPLGSELVWQQLLALGLVTAFVGTVRVLDLLYHATGTRLEDVDSQSGRSGR